jgi:hypothetical protein
MNTASTPITPAQIEAEQDALKADYDQKIAALKKQQRAACDNLRPLSELIQHRTSLLWEVGRAEIGLRISLERAEQFRARIATGIHSSCGNGLEDAGSDIWRIFQMDLPGACAERCAQEITRFIADKRVVLSGMDSAALDLAMERNLAYMLPDDLRLKLEASTPAKSD